MVEKEELVLISDIIHFLKPLHISLVNVSKEPFLLHKQVISKLVSLHDLQRSQSFPDDYHT